MNIIERLRQVCLKKGDKPAVISNGIILSFHDLWEQSENLAGFLAANYDDEKPIIVYGHKNPLMLVCFLACVKSGHPYCPVDISVPYVRIMDIINTIEKPVVLATEEFAAPRCTVISCDKIRQISTFHLPHAQQAGSKLTQSDTAKSVQHYAANAAQSDMANPVQMSSMEAEAVSQYADMNPEKTMYIIFTSGSTGKPKGVEISIGNLSRFIDWSLTLFDEKGEKADSHKEIGESHNNKNQSGGNQSKAYASSDEHVMNQAPFSFDLSVMDTYTALAGGKTLYLLPKSLQKEVRDILKFIEESRINYMVSTPSFANMLLADKNFDASNYGTIRQFLFCGERLSKETAGALIERFPDARVINTYGPTESTVAVTGVEITKEHLMAEEELPIGVPKQGTEIRIENGEIIIAGDTVGKGYYKEPEKTEASFYTDKNGIRCYRTGDTGYINTDSGMLYYIGRMDNQIKLHGYRIEIGDIESNLIQIPGITDAAVLPKMKDGQIRSLTAFVAGFPSEYTEDVSRKNSAGSAVCDFETGKYIKAQLAEKLPHYMIPKKIKFIMEMPLTGNGKKDRKRLAEML